MVTWRERFLDAFVTYFLLGPVMVVGWISLWVLVSTELIYPHDKQVSIWISVTVGFAGSLAAYFGQGLIRKVAFSRGCVVFLVVSRVYTYLMFFISANQWRSVWDGLDLYTGVSEYNAVISATAAFLGLLMLKCGRQVVFAPCVVVMDYPMVDYFKINSYFDTKPSETWRYIGDVLFTVFFVNFLGFTVWRGVWHATDFFLFPEDKEVSALLSLIISYSTLVLICILQPFLIWLCATAHRVHWAPGFLVEIVVTALVSLSCILYWRGYWILYDVYIPGYGVRYWAGHVTAVLILVCSMAFNSVLIRGVSLDLITPDGLGVVHQVPYISNLIQTCKSEPELALKNVFTSLCAIYTKASDQHKNPEFHRMTSMDSSNHSVSQHGPLEGNGTKKMADSEEEKIGMGGDVPSD